MAELEDNIINLGEYFTDRAAQMFKGVLAEQNKNIAALTKAVGKIDNSQKSTPKKQDTTLSKDLKKIQDENRKLMAQNRNESLKLAIMSKDLKKQELEMRQSSLKDKKQFKFLNSIAYTPSQLKEIDKATHQSNYQKQIDKMNKSRITNILPILRQQIKDQATNPSFVPGLKPLKMNKSGWHNADLLSKGAIPIDWKPQDKFQKMQIGLLGNLLNISKSTFTLDKKQQKVWDKFMKGFTGSAASFGSSILEKAAPTLTDLIKMKIYKALYGFVGGSKNKEDYQNRSKWAKRGVLATNMLLDPGSLMAGAGVLGSLWGGKKALSSWFSKPGSGKGTSGAVEKGAVEALEEAPKLSKLAKFAKFGKNIPGLNMLALTMSEIPGIMQGFKKGKGSQSLAMAGGSIGGGLLGGAGGTAVGAAIGTLIAPGIGTAVGAVIGDILGTIIGSKLGKVLISNIVLPLTGWLGDMFRKLFPALFAGGGVKFSGHSFQNAKEDLKRDKEFKKMFHPVANEFKRVSMHTKEVFKNVGGAFQSLGNYVIGKGSWSSKRGGTSKGDLVNLDAMGNLRRDKFVNDKPQVQKAFARALSAAQAEITQKYGKNASFDITGALATKYLDKKTGKYKWSHDSMQHKVGTAVDIGKVRGMTKENAIDVLAKYGITRPNAKGDPIHFELTDAELAKKQEMLAAKNNNNSLIASSQPTVQTKAPTRSINSGSNYDPTKNKETMTAVLNSYSR